MAARLPEPWMMVRLSLPDDRDVVRMASRLKLSTDEVLGKVIRFWVWIERNCDKSYVSDVTFSWVDSHIRCPGFAEAMELVGWLSRHENGGIIIPNFDVWFSKSAKVRALAAKRVDRMRLGRRNNSNDSDVTSDVTIVTTQAHHRDRVIKEENKTPPTPSRNKPTTPAIPDTLDTPAFRAAWDEWQQHRREKRSPLTPTTARRQLKRLADVGPEKAVEMIHYSVGHGWTGLFAKEGDDAKPRSGGSVGASSRLGADPSVYAGRSRKIDANLPTPDAAEAEGGPPAEPPPDGGGDRPGPPGGHP